MWSNICAGLCGIEHEVDERRRRVDLTPYIQSLACQLRSRNEEKLQLVAAQLAFASLRVGVELEHFAGQALILPAGARSRSGARARRARRARRTTRPAGTGVAEIVKVPDALEAAALAHPDGAAAARDRSGRARLRLVDGDRRRARAVRTCGRSSCPAEGRLWMTATRCVASSAPRARRRPIRARPTARRRGRVRSPPRDALLHDQARSNAVVMGRSKIRSSVSTLRLAACAPRARAPRRGAARVRRRRRRPAVPMRNCTTR